MMPSPARIRSSSPARRRRHEGRARRRRGEIDQLTGGPMKLASFKAARPTTYGPVTQAPTIHLAPNSTHYPPRLALFRAQALAKARAAATGRPDYQIKDVEMLPPILAPEKNICVGINYPDRSAEYKDDREAPKYPNLFCRFPSSLVG